MLVMICLVALSSQIDYPVVEIAAAVVAVVVAAAVIVVLRKDC